MSEKLTHFELSVEFLDRFKLALEEADHEFIRASLDGVDYPDISELLDEVNAEEAKYVISLLKKPVGANIISELEEDVQKKFLKEFEALQIAEFLEELETDDGADILNLLPFEIKEQVIYSMKDEKKIEDLLDLIRYDDDTAGGLMAKEMIKVNENWKVSQCINEIKRQAENVEKVYSVYVVDDKDRLLGRISLKRLILANNDKFVKEIYQSDVRSVESYMAEEEVADIMRKYDLDAVPVLNIKGKLIGRITIDDIVDVITEQAEEERQIMAGISEDIEEDDSVWMLSRARLPWLIIGMAGGLLGARFIGLFEHDIALIPAVAFFIPLITATGGNVGIQSSSIVVQTLANRPAFEEGTLKRLFKVLVVAVINGLVLSTLVLGANYLLGEDLNLALVVAIALFAVVLLASFMGTITPLILNKIGINPAMASGPFITTTNDLLGLGVYFLVAHLLYNL